jgi:hypothetical protein
MDAVAADVPPELALMLARMVQRWVETRNPYFLDFVLVLLAENGVPIPYPILAGLSTVAHQRLMGAVPSGTPTQVRKEVHLERTFELIAHLRAAGRSLDAAVSKAAREARDRTGNTWKASTLERKYKKSMWPSREPLLKKQHARTKLRGCGL